MAQSAFRRTSGGWSYAVFVTLAVLAAGFRGIAQEFPFAPGVLDRIQVVIETFGGSVSKKTTNTLAPNAPLQITDSTFPLSGQSIKLQFDGQPPVQPILNGTLQFNFPAVTPARDISGVFQPPMPAAVTFDGTWTKGDFNYPMGEAVSYAAAQVLLTSIQPTACPNTATSRVRTGAPIPVGVNPVSVSATCDMKSLSGLGGGDPLETEHAASGVLQIIAGDGGAGENPIFSQVGATVVYYAVYKSRRRPEIAILQNTINFSHTDGQPFPQASIVTLTNTGGLPLNWTAVATNTSPTTSGNPTWLKLTPAGGTLESLGTQPIQVSVDTTGLAPGSYGARVTVAGNTWNGSKTFNVTFKYTGTPRLTITPDTLEFFNTVAFPQRTLTLKNEGSARLVWKATTTSTNNWLNPNFSSDELLPGQTKELLVRAFSFQVPEPGDYTGQMVFEPFPGNPPEMNFPPITITGVFHVLVPKDELAILAGTVTPSANEPIKLNTEYTNFRADVTYQLGTRTDADLALRLFDETGNLQGSSDFIRVWKSDGLVASRRLTIPKVKITTGGLGTTPAKLILRAVLLDRSLLTTIKSTPETDYVYAVEPAIKLSLGHGSNVGDFQPAFPAELIAGSYNLGAAGWPVAAVVELPKGDGIRGVNLTARLFRASGLSRFYTTLTTPVAAGFEGKLFLDLMQSGFNALPDECGKHRADLVQFRANVVNLDATTIEQSPQIELPVERINLIAADPPFGTTLPRSEPHQIKFTAEYNVPNFGPRIITRAIDPDGEACARPNDSVVKDEVLGPGRAQFTYEATAFFPVITENETKFSASVALFEGGAQVYARDCEPHFFILSDKVTLPVTPGQQVVAADAKVIIVSNPGAVNVEASSPWKSLAAVTSDAGGGPVALSLAKRHASLRRHANEPLGLADVITLNQVWHFTPAIAAGTGFSADLSLTWTPAVVPDDPNFSEANLKVISLNPATGALRAYDTTLNLPTRTAAARVDSLEAYYTLGVVGPFGQQVVNFPLLQGPSGFTSRALVTAVGEGSGLSLTALDGAGQTLAGEANPLAGFVGAGAATSLPIPAAFGVYPQVQDGWLQGVVSANAGALLRLERTNAADAIPSLRAFPRVLVPGLEQNATYTTELRIANPTRFANPITLELHNDAGTAVGTFETVLGARSTLVGAIGEFFPEAPANFSGYVTARGDTDLVAAALVQSATTLAVIEGQPLGLKAPVRLVAPGFATGGANHRARVTLANTGAAGAALTLRAVGDSGSNLAAPLVVNLAAGQQYRAELGGAFGLNAGTLTRGTLIVEGDVTGLVGEVTLLDAGGSDLFRTSQPLQGEPATRNSFAYFDNAAGRFSELSAYNPAATAALLTVTAFRPDGATVGSVSLSLAAGAWTTGRLTELIGPSAGVAGGSVVIESSQPIFSSVLVGEDSLNTLSAIPPHTVEAIVPSDPPTLTVTVTPTQLVLSWPASAAGFVLQSAPGLAAPINWQLVPNPAVTANGRKTVTVDLNGVAGFYRLTAP